MDIKIIEQLQQQSSKYLSQFKEFPDKTDLVAVFEFEYNNYLVPIIDNILPQLSRRLFEVKTESIDFYLPYISERYHINIRTEILNLLKNHDYLNKKKAKEIQNYFHNETLKYSKSTNSEKETFINDFITHYINKIIEISDLAPSVCLLLLAELRNPRLQNFLLKNPVISKNMHTYINEKLVFQPWDTWINKHFTYPRTKDMEEYYSKWIGRDKLHIKMCSKIFSPEHYEQAKMWLKGMEKKSEIERKNSQ